MPMGGGGSGGGGSSVIDAGRAAVKLSADKAGLKKDLDSAQQMVMKWGKGIAAAGAGLLGAGGSLLGGIGLAFNSAVDKFDAVKKAADRLGTSTEIISELGYAAEISGSNFEEMEAALRNMQKNLIENEEGFDKLGLSAENLRKMNLDEQFEAVAEAISELDGASASAAAMDLLGKAGAKLIPTMKNGAAGIREMREEARKVGSSIGGEDAANAERAGDAIGRAWTTAKNTFIAVGAALLPQVQRIEMLSAVVVGSIGTVREWINENRQMVLAVTVGAAAVAAAGVALITLGTSLAVASFAASGLVAAWGALTAVLAAFVSPLAIVVVGLAAAAAVFTLLFVDLKKLEDAASSVVDAFAPIADTVKDTFKGISDAIKGNDLKLAFEIMVAGLEVVWEEFMMGMRKSWKELAKGGEKPTESPQHFIESGWNSAKYLFNEGLFAFGEGVDDLFGGPTPEELAKRTKAAIKRSNASQAKEDEIAEAAIAETNAKQAKLDALKKALAKKTEEAANLTSPEAQVWKEVFYPKKAEIVQALSELGSSRGGFGGANASARFGVGDVQQKQLKELEGIHREVKKRGGGIPVE